ncbi:beta-class carbonic anhydrase [Oceanobacillus iheyensis]|uniref:beta-class carbonic anhydrase n=1 Tax=Oceanobacillus iheyensis TaxID=182710 RepID=UPI003641C6D1
MHLDHMLEFNKNFVENKSYESYSTNTYPNKRMVVFTCMDSRLLELLPKALDFKNGDVKMVRNAGAIIRDPFDSAMKSLLVAIYKLQADEVVIIGHHDCGMSHVDTKELKNEMIERGINKESIDVLANGGVDFDKEFQGFETVEESVSQGVNLVRNHPLLPEEIKVHGLVIHPDTGKVDVVTREELK